MSSRRFLTEAGRSILLPRGPSARIGAGGQGQVFRCQLGGDTVAIKLGRQLDEQRLIALQRLQGPCSELATLPRHRIYDGSGGQPGALAGYAMRYLDQQTSVSAARLFNFQEIAAIQSFSWRDAVLAALSLAEVVTQLHRHGVVVGDLNPENVLFERQGTGGTDNTWRAVLLDSDSFQIEAATRRFYCPVSRPPYTAPELIGCDFSATWREPSSDAFALAVIVYQLLLHDHPYDNAVLPKEPELAVTSRIRRGLYPHAAAPMQGLSPGPYRPAPAEVSPEIDAAFRRSFCCAPGLRPSPSEWVLLLSDLRSQVVPCGRNPRHHHTRHQPCLWCSLEQRIGQTICGYSPVSAQPPIKAAATSNGERLEVGASQVEARLMQARTLVVRRAALIEELLQLQPLLEGIRGPCSSPGQLVDEQAVRARLGGLRQRLSRWLGHHHKVAARQQHAEQLIALAASTVALAGTQSQRFERERQGLLNRLSTPQIAELADQLPLSDPTHSAAVLWRQAAERRHVRWLRMQLAQQPLHNWRIDGFGQGRMALLERHGIACGDHLLDHIDQLTALPGIGRGLQARLRQHLQLEISRLNALAEGASSSDREADLLTLALNPQTVQRIHHHQAELDSLSESVASLKCRTTEMSEEIQHRLSRRDALLAAYQRLF